MPFKPFTKGSTKPDKKDPKQPVSKRQSPIDKAAVKSMPVKKGGKCK